MKFFDKNGLSGFLFYISFIVIVLNTVLLKNYVSVNVSSMITIVSVVVLVVTSTLMFNGRPASENDKIELERILKEFFVKALLKKRADEENDRQKKKRNSKID